VSDGEPKSPCISVCALDEDDVCVGCFRKASEITDWFMATPEQKQEVLKRAAQRRDESFPVRLS
jgi:predicted Fe-S protein YdhL (DUF1289 family)